MCQRPHGNTEGKEVNSHCGGEMVIFFMDYVMYFLLAVVKEERRREGLGVLTLCCFQTEWNM